MPATDLRVQRTQTALKEAFRTLALKYPRYRDISSQVSLISTAKLSIYISIPLTI